jgi:membrane protease YdiL (CAAX protease family)
VSERLYRIRNPSGAEFGPASLGEACALIGQGRIMLDAIASEGSSPFLPITQFPVFAKAFEARYGIDGQPHTSDSTPKSDEPTHASSDPFKEATESDVVPRRPPFIDDADTAIAPAARGRSFIKIPDVTPLLEPSPSEDVITGSSDQPTPIGLTKVDDPNSRTGDLDRTPVSLDTPAIAPIDDLPIDDPPIEERDRTQVSANTPIFEETSSDVEIATPVTSGAMTTVSDASPFEPVLISTLSAGPPTPPGPPLVTPVFAPGPPIIQGLPLAPPPPAADRNLESMTLPPKDATKRVAVALATWGILVGILFGSGVIAKLGWTEAQYLANSGFFYVRIAVLAVLGVALSAILLSNERPKAQSFGLSSRWAMIALGAGALGGVLAPLQHIRSSLPIALSMTTLQAIAEESFFRGYLDRALAPAFPELVSRTAVGATLFGLYTLTYASMWLGRSPIEALLWSFAMTLVAGVPLSLFYHLSKSFLVPLLCHLTLNLTMIAMSILRG